MSLDLDSFVAVPISTSLYAALLRRFPDRVSAAIEDVVSDFLERTEEDVTLSSGTAGIYWEALFLPNGTLIRTKYFGEYKTASIEEEFIVWNGERYPSMAQLTNKMRGDTSNNAWRELEIKRPGDKQWIPAQALRR